MSLTIVRYFIAETDVYEEPKHPNIIKFPNRASDEITLMILKKRLEALGSFRYFFKTIPHGKPAEEFVWEDVIEDYFPVPTFNGDIVLKAVRLEDKLRRMQPNVNAQPVSTPPTTPLANNAAPSSPTPRGLKKASDDGTPPPSRYSAEELQKLEQLEKQTHFSLKELKAMYSRFKKEAPTLEIDKEGFVKVTEGMGIKDKFLQELIFNKFDSDRSGSVDFSEFVIGMSVITRGTPEERLESAFRMYDLEGRGLISKSGFVKIMQSLMDYQGGTITILGKAYKDTESLCDAFFSIIDNNGDGEITYEEYKVGALQHPDFLQALRII